MYPNYLEPCGKYTCVIMPILKLSLIVLNVSRLDQCTWSLYVTAILNYGAIYNPNEVEKQIIPLCKSISSGLFLSTFPLYLGVKVIIFVGSVWIIIISGSCYRPDLVLGCSLLWFNHLKTLTESLSLILFGLVIPFRIFKPNLSQLEILCFWIFLSIRLHCGLL